MQGKNQVKYFVRKLFLQNKSADSPQRAEQFLYKKLGSKYTFQAIIETISLQSECGLHEKRVKNGIFCSKKTLYR